MLPVRLGTSTGLHAGTDGSLPPLRRRRRPRRAVVHGRAGRRCSASSGRNGAGKTTAMRIVLGRARARRRRGALARAGRSTSPTRAAVRLHARGAGPVPEDAGRRPARLLRPAARAGRRRGRRRRPTAGSSGSGSPTGPTTASRSCPSATSSGCSSRPRWSTTRSCSSSTSRSPASTRSASTSWRACCATSAATARAVVFSSHQLELVERLCDAVGDHQRRDGCVASGRSSDAAASRGAAQNQVRVRSRAPTATAGSGVPGAGVLDAARRQCSCSPPAAPIPTPVLDAARAAGRVTYFARERPTLSSSSAAVVLG